jgi:hypothetical protein
MRMENLGKYGEDDMVSFAYTLLMFVKVIFAFTLLYIFIPSRVIRFENEGNGFLDRLFISLTHMVFITIVIVHFLVFLKVYEIFSLLFAYIAIYVYVHFSRGKSWAAVAEAMGMKLVVQLLEISDGRMGFIKEASLRFRQWIIREKILLLEYLKCLKQPFVGVIPIVILLAAAYLRLKPSFTHSYYISSDTYVHLAYTKFLGFNEIYYYGIYSQGYHAIISAMSKLFFIDPYWLLRFIGPLGGILLVLSVYYFSLKITKSCQASIIAIMTFGLVTNDKLPSIMFRQAAALPQEFSAIFILPGVYFLWLYIKSEKRIYLLLFAETLTITLSIHLYSTIFLTIWAGILLIIAFFLLKLNLRAILNVFYFSLTAAIIGVLPIAVGRLMGIEFFKSSSDFLLESIKGGSFNWDIFVQVIKDSMSNPFLAIILVLIPILILSIIFIKTKETKIMTLSLTIIILSAFVQYQAFELNLPTITDKIRTGFYFSIILTVFYACGFNIVIAGMSNVMSNQTMFFQKLLHNISLILICSSILFYYPPQHFDISYTNEYDAAVDNYLKIKADFPIHDWTIVSPTEQFQQALGYGWHYEILNFVKEFTVEDMEDAQFKLPIPTSHIFFYTEKIPLYTGRRVTEQDAEKNLDPSNGNDPHLQYYGSPEQRAIIQAKAIKLIEAYARTHTGVSVYYEDENMKIYHIYHETPAVLAESGVS